MKTFRTFLLAGASLALAVAGSVAQADQPSAQASPPQVGFRYPNTIAQYDVGITMPDGVRLSATVLRPADDQKHPTVFLQTPYGKDASAAQVIDFVNRGYAYVSVDVRGRFDSGGDFAPFRDAADGAHVLDWIAQQDWSNGQVATIGASYSGNSQWNLWRERNPHQSAIVSYVAPADGFGDFVRFNGVPKLDLIFTWMMQEYGRVNHPHEVEDFDWGEVMAALPLSTIDQRNGRRVQAWEDAMREDRFGPYWQPLQATGNTPGRDIPTFNVTGWYEGQLLGAVRNYENARGHSATPGNHVLVIGPWLHGVNRNRVIGALDAGPQAIIDLDSLRDRWMDHVLLGREAPTHKNFIYFLPALNQWRQADAFPIPGTQYRSMRLSSGGHANTAAGDGMLVEGNGRGAPDTFTYDPNHPVPSLSSRTAGARGGLPQGSVDHASVEQRDDVLVYTGQPLAEDVEVTGPVRANIYISSDVVDTDVVVRLMDVYPDGRSLNIAEGIARAKYRNSMSDPELMQPGQVYRIPVDLFPTSNYFRAGHRFRVEVTSSDFPVFGRNLNTANSDSGTETAIAHTRVHHDRRYTSEIILPIVPRGASEPFDPPMQTAAAQPAE
ncbi:CocE/NonD family hydrolase [Sphingosinicella ginsenosidimutans]|uniref:CocE/NonD family hydrolase n=1 Tax=Allosphingosinicella ginsenosidimutans TaxID=1176539 RepID=A0A5C6TQA7_9SPHN|nr:CocE/NonD family hydrolase [Sphingosinicella ginsenosidimutans]TXC62554.1 CocE/NonD family hydrolase [Sphingosinicella ginsenosidimutans]